MSFWDRLTESAQMDCIDQNAVQKIARRKAYSPKGIARQKWTTEVYPTIKDILNDPGNRARIYGASSKHPICSFRLFMLENNTAWKPARPTIVVLCIDKKFARRAVDLLEKMSMLKKSVLGFDFLTSQEEIRLAADESDTASQVAHHFGPSLCGARVLISPSKANRSWARTTVGGVILINGRSYALTTAHAFFHTREDARHKQSEESNSNGAPSTISDGDSDSDDQDHGHDNVPPQGRRPTQFNEDRSETETTQMETRFIYLDNRDTSPQSPRAGDGEAESRPASIRDEDLIGNMETSANTHYLSSSVFNLENDWALFEIASSFIPMLNTIESPAGDILETNGISQTGPNGPVLVAAGVSGLLQTECSGLLSGIILPDSRQMLDIWTLPTSCLPGDCGAWVLDRQNGDVFGMIVATSYELQESYCLPISTIFDSILAIRPANTTISFPGTVNPAYSIPPPYHSHSPSNKYHANSDAPSDHHHDAQERIDAEERIGADSEMTSPKLGTRRSTFETTAESEQSSNDETGQSRPISPEVQDVVDADEVEDVEEIYTQHAQPSSSRWTRVETREFPIASLDSLVVPWRKAEGEDHIMIDREIAAAVRRVRAQHSPTSLEGLSSEARATITEAHDPRDLPDLYESTDKHLPPTEINSPPAQHITIIRRQPTIETLGSNSPERVAEEMNFERKDDDPSHLNKETGPPYPRRGKTRMPRRLVSMQALSELGYPAHLQDDVVVITKALGRENIDEVIELSRTFLGERSPTMKPAEIERGEDIVEVIEEVIEKVIKEVVDGSRMTILTETQAEGRVLHMLAHPFFVEDNKYHVTRALDQDDIDEIVALTKQYRNREGAPIDRPLNSTIYMQNTVPTSSLREVVCTKYDLLFEDEIGNLFSENSLPNRYVRELVQTFRENRTKLSQAITFLEHTHSGSGTATDTLGLSDRRPRVTIVEERNKSWSPPPRRLPSPETIVSRTTHEVRRYPEEIIERDRIVIRTDSPRRPPPRRTHTIDSDRYGEPERDRSVERIEIRREGERTDKRYDDIEIFDRNERNRRNTDFPPPKGTFDRGTQDDDNTYRSATQDWAIIDIPPGTKMTSNEGAPRRYFPDTTGREIDRERDNLAKVTEKEKSVRFERLREPRTYRSSQLPFMTSYARVDKQYVSPEALDHYRLDWQWDRDDVDFILIRENVSEDLRQRLFKYTQDRKGQKLIKNLAEFRDDELDNIVREARAANRERELEPPRAVGRDREEVIKKLAEMQEGDLDNIVREARVAKTASSARPREERREREEISFRRVDREGSDRRHDYEFFPSREVDRYSVRSDRDYDRADPTRDDSYTTVRRYYDETLSRPRSFERERERSGEEEEVTIRRRRPSTPPPPPSPTRSTTSRKPEDSALVVRRRPIY